MKAVTKVTWLFPDNFALNHLYQRYIQAIQVVVDRCGFIPPSTDTPRDNARYLILVFKDAARLSGRIDNNLSFEEHVGGLTSVYSGSNGTLTFSCNYNKTGKPEAKIVYDYNQETDWAISLEHLGAMVSILGVPETFDIQFSKEDRTILLPVLIKSGAVKLGA